VCFLTYDDEHHRLALIPVPGLQAPTESTLGLASKAYSYATLRDLLSTWKRLKQQGIRPYRLIGMPFVPQDLAAAFEIGAPEEKLLRCL
jgi:hypothetical protein